MTTGEVHLLPALDRVTGGAYIGEEGHRREAFNVMLSMPRDTDPLIVQRAAREFAEIEFTDHRYVMMLHDHQANPHVHLSVKAGSKHGERLNPRKADLQKKSGEPHRLSRQEALDAWRRIFVALADSKSKDDQALAKRIADFVKDMPMMKRTIAVQRDRQQVPLDRGREPARERVQLTADRTRNGPEMER